jgi:hypothetical protein
MRAILNLIRFAAAGTIAVEAKLTGRNSINYDVNPVAVELAKKLAVLDEMTKQAKLGGDVSDNAALQSSNENTKILF